MSPPERLKLLLFLALLSGAAGFLFTLLSCGTEYWLLAVESCRQVEDGDKGVRPGKVNIKAMDGVRIFHEGLFWRCSFMALHSDFSMWDFWITNQPHSKICQTAFLFPFPVGAPMWVEPHEQPSAIAFRAFWSIFLVTGVTAVLIGGFLVMCAASLASHKLYRIGGAFHACGGLCLLAVVVMYLMWVQVMDTLEQFALHHKSSTCPSFHLNVQHGPSFLLAPVAIFFFLLAGLLFFLMGQSTQRLELDRIDKSPSTTEL
ncbi:transmembrane protein 182 isoform X2 [Nothobranchius furzeri]|uniref:Transmembrane protein 182 n=1 Tax=Nothobranchius furzeri TaxID=105023 RepID=A0A9D3C1Z5_NOTFU|nr:transmembrane protein 182 isoform X2 [Nothobranchius furzeri]KAF7230156.1 transcript variant X2 [Nothobranchius furzeri]